jgi:hypothetical protein
MKQHLLTRLAPSTATRAAQQFLTRQIAPTHAETPLPAVLDLEALPTEERTLQQMVEALNPADSHRAGQIPWTQRTALVDVLTPALNVLERSYPQPAHRAFTQIVPVMNFREQTFITGLDGLTLSVVPEHGEYQRVNERSIGVEIETAAMKVYGLILTLSRETLTNDSASRFFASAANALTGAAYRHEIGTVYGLLESNPNMADGQPWFDSSNSVTKPSILGALESGFSLFAGQQFQSGEYVDCQPGVLVVPASWSIMASDILSDILLSVGTGRLQIIKSGRISSAYLFANPAECPSIGLAGFGEVRPSVELNNRIPLNSNAGLELKIRHEYAAVPLSRVGVVKMSLTS